MVAERRSADTDGVGDHQEAYEVRRCRHAHSQDGSTSVEYGLLAFAIGIGLVIAGPVLAEAFLELLNFIMEALLDRPLYTRS